MAEDVTEWLRAWRGGDAAARDRLVAAMYAELHAVAGRQFRGERADHTLQPTALVHEAWQRLVALERIDWQDRIHFVAVAARLMRQVLADHARRRGAAKRDGGERVDIDDLHIPLETGVDGIDAADLDRALARLEALDPVKGQVVELRYYGGLSIEETAEALGLSPATVKRHWQAARVWLFDALAPRRTTAAEDPTRTG